MVFIIFAKRKVCLPEQPCNPKNPIQNLITSLSPQTLENLKLYGIPNCDTIKRARKWLNDKGVAYEFHDYKKHGITRQKLNEWMAQRPWDKLLNRAGTTWRRLPEEEKARVVDANSAAEFLAGNTSAIKRPILEKENAKIIAVGFDVEDYQTLFS